jgi:hypothetical protein
MLPDVVKNTEYEMNLALHFGYDEQKKWYADVTKVQGGLCKFFPQDKRLTKIPFDELFAYAKKIDKVTPAAVEKSEDEIASDTFDHTSAGLIAYGKEKGLHRQRRGSGAEGCQYYCLRCEQMEQYDRGD